MAQYKLNPDEIAVLNRPVNGKGKGGFESLFRRLRKQVNHHTGEINLTPKDLDAIQRYAFDYKSGGFESRLLTIFGRVLGPRLGREERAEAR